MDKPILDKRTIREQYLDLLSAQAEPYASDPPGVVNGILRDPQAYFFWLINRSIGQDAGDWVGVLTQCGIPAGYGPGVRPTPNGFYGLTQQIGGDGVRGRVFLPTATPDGLGYYTRPVDVLEGEAPTLRWKWRELGGPAYAPVADQGDTTTPEPGEGLTPAEVQAMIDASIATALAPVNAQLAQALKMGDKTALRMPSGMFVGFVTGGPTAENAPIQIIARPEAHAWEMVKHEPEGAKAGAVRTVAKDE